MQSTKAGFEFTTFRMLGESEICARYPLVYLVTLAMSGMPAADDQILGSWHMSFPPRRAGSGHISGGLGGDMSPPAGFRAEPRKLSDFKRFESQCRYLRASKNDEWCKQNSCQKKKRNFSSMVTAQVFSWKLELNENAEGMSNCFSRAL